MTDMMEKSLLLKEGNVIEPYAVDVIRRYNDGPPEQGKKPLVRMNNKIKIKNMLINKFFLKYLK